MRDHRLSEDGPWQGKRYGQPESEFRIEKIQLSFLSVIIPARNEALNLSSLVSEVVLTLRRLCDYPLSELDAFEVIVIDDHSTDATTMVLRRLMRDFPELRSLKLSQHSGQSAATLAGIHEAKGNWIATLDADLQNVPSDLIRLWRVLPSQNSAVLGWRVRRFDPWIKRIISLIANRVRNKILGQSIRDTGCSVRIFPREIAVRVPKFDGMHRFWGALLLREGCQIIQRPVRHRPRLYGHSHYGLWNRSIQVLADLMGVAWLISRSLGYGAIPVRDSAGDRYERLSGEQDDRLISLGQG
jgi:glycosyltransferase involved in cell wall biosynthesis